MSRAWLPSPDLLRQIAQLLLRVGLAALFGVWIGHPWPLVTLTLLLSLIVHLRYLTRLRSWLNAPKQIELPIAEGIWGEVYDGLLNLQKRNRKRKRKLAAILAEFQASTEALPDGAVVLGPNGEIVWFNTAAQALLGLRVQQDIGLRIANLVRKPAFTEYFSRDDYSGEVECDSPINSETMLSFRIIPYGNGQRLMIVRDVSDLRRLETARRDFVANASHELRTPLTVLRGYLDVMEPETRKGGTLHDWASPMSEMRAQAARMEALINDLLKLARLEANIINTRQDLLDVPKMLARTQEQARTMSKGQHRIEFEIEPDLRLYGRDSETQSVFTNLVSNAVQYTPPGGIIGVRWWGDDSGAHFSVADTGIGIAEKDLPRLTERFYRVDTGRSRATGGTGLGLSIVKHALEHLDGKLSIESEVGVGTTFTCSFPVHRVHHGNQRNDLRAPMG
ncbi:MAG: phosphate regulon sensor histidine kinase PhoR [Gammaproteobacteria bacterium]|uniref:phosphate regulon sensor histidine kinase PhoR n=1 Tax=Nevskia sp. TaxID=1929292 RepID=UPI0040358E54|nr:phosphate regulon sensor histidine kinase PhoR [Gammaproteobacteria bacterium]